MKKWILILGISVSALSSSGYAQSAGDVQKLLTSEAEKLRALGREPVVVTAVKAQNAKKLTLAAIKDADERWMAGNDAALVKQVTTGACADRLRVIAAANPAYDESFAMDSQGAIVCATAKTSDYWQGDEAKWERAYAGGKGGVFIDRPKFDDSAKARIAQISVPVMDGERAIGAITVGIIIEELK